MADQPLSPFAGLVTPDVLKYARRQQKAAEYADMPFWTRRAASYGSELSEALKDQGIGLDEEDQKALVRERVLIDATKEAREKMAAGELSPDDAQRYLLQSAMQAFIAEGDYESASQIAPQLAAWQKKDMELQKIQSEIGANQTEQYQDVASGVKNYTEAGKTAALVPGELEKQAAAADADRALAEQRRRIDPKDAAGGGFNFATREPDKQQIREYENLASGTLGYLQRVQKLTGLILSNPGIGSKTAGSVSNVVSEMWGALGLVGKDKTTFFGTPVPRAKEYLNATEEGVLEGKRAKIRAEFAASGNLTRDRNQYESYVVDIAYALAKARDPGGRLSNADVDNALRILGATGDPQAMAAVLKEITAQTTQDFRNRQVASPVFQTHPVNARVEEEYGKYNALIDAYTKRPKEKPGKPAAKETKEERRARLAKKYGTQE